MDMLDEVGIDSVEVRKVSTLLYEIDFKETGKFTDFKNHSLEPEN
ncbi:MAG TPA: hypothetical protein PLT50_03290 [bacterium]|nr:hypothetical protein [bacterium]